MLQLAANSKLGLGGKILLLQLRVYKALTTVLYVTLSYRFMLPNTNTALLHNQRDNRAAGKKVGDLAALLLIFHPEHILLAWSHFFLPPVSSVVDAVGDEAEISKTSG